jgi:hypothetical protein
MGGVGVNAYIYDVSGDQQPIYTIYKKSTTSTDFFALKFSSVGKLLWASKTLPVGFTVAAPNSQVRGCQVDASGNMYMVGSQNASLYQAYHGKVLLY